MPFRFSEFAKRGKTGNPFSDTDDRATASRPMTANSYDFSRPTRPPQPPPVPQTPVSISYDKGRGRLSPDFIREQGLPPSVRNTDQLAEFIRNRKAEERYASSPTSASHYSYTTNSPATGVHRSDSGHASLSYELPRPGACTARENSNPIAVAGLRNRYASRPVARVLPGTTRKHQGEGKWLNRGTLRKTTADLKDHHKWWKKTTEEKAPSDDGTYVESSGWYDD